MFKRLALGLAVFGFLAGAPAASAGDLKLAIANGRVTLVAKDVPLRQILAEWSRVGQTRIVNGEKVTGAPLTLQLLDVPERQAIEVLLRSVSGYLAAPRPEAIAGISQYDRIMILPGSPSIASAAAGSPGRVPPQPIGRTPPQPRAIPMPAPQDESMENEEVEEAEDAEDEEEDNEELSEDEIDNEDRQIPVQPQMPLGVARPGQPVMPPGTNPADPNQPNMGSPVPQPAGTTAPRPGVVVTPPQQPQQFRPPTQRKPPQNPPR